MNQYHKIDTIYKRDPSGKQVLWGEYSRPEFEYLKDNLWVFTEKVDGTNIRVMYFPDLFEEGQPYPSGSVAFGGKTDNAQIPTLLYQRLQELFPVERVAGAFDKADAPICLYGEGYGPKIQSGGKYKATPDFVLFDVKVGDWWLRRDQVEDVAAKLDLGIVPIVGRGTLHRMEAMVESGFYSQWGDFPAEGIVARPECELKDRAGHRIVTKLKLKDFEAVKRA